MSASSEAQPRSQVDAALAAAGWTLQDGNQANLSAGYAIALRRFPLAFSPTHGNSDYLLYVSGVIAGVVRILPELPMLIEPDEEQIHGAEAGDRRQKDKAELNDNRVLPSAEPMHWQGKAKPSAERRQGTRAAFVYETDGTRIQFRDVRKEPARAHALHHFHRPFALAAWLSGTAAPLDTPQNNVLLDPEGLSTERFLDRLQAIPRIGDRALWPGERLVLEALQTSLRRGNRRVLAQMAPGSGKTHTLLNIAYQLLEHANAARVLLLVDNDPLAYQTCEEFRSLRPPVYASPSATPLPFDITPEAHTLAAQQLSGRPLDPAARLVIGSSYRLLAHWPTEDSSSEDIVSLTTFSSDMTKRLPSLRGEGSAAEEPDGIFAAPRNSKLPTETFDVILCDDLSPDALKALTPVFNYFDAPLLAVCGTLCRFTLELFGNRVVAEYPYEQAIADGAILPFETYAIRVKPGIADNLETQAGPLEIHREPELVTRLERWRKTDDCVGPSSDFSRDSAMEHEERSLADFTLLLALRDRLPREIFPQRTQVPKTLLVARDQTHAESLLELTREVFSTNEEFARILSMTGPKASGEYEALVFRKVSEKRPHALGEPRTPSPDAHYPYLTAFRSDVLPRIGIVPADSFAVTVDLRPTELLVLMTCVRSRAHFEAIKGRAIRALRRAEYLRISPDGHPAAGKTRAVIVDTVGIFDTEAPSESFPLDRRPGVPLAQLLQDVAFGAVGDQTARSMAARFLQLDCVLSPGERDSVAKAAGGATLHTLAMRLLAALDVNRQIAQASRALRPGATVSEKMIEQAATALLQQAVARIHSSVGLRNIIIQLHRQHNPKPSDAGELDESQMEDLGNEETWR
ncbi:MAG: DEAD/DEAH box helicase family protein [Candidatus Sumerlaeaceae bacterium]